MTEDLGQRMESFLSFRVLRQDCVFVPNTLPSSAQSIREVKPIFLGNITFFVQPRLFIDAPYEVTNCIIFIIIIVGDKSNNAVEGTVNVVRLDTPPKEQPPYERNLDAVD